MMDSEQLQIVKSVSILKTLSYNKPSSQPACSFKKYLSGNNTIENQFFSLYFLLCLLMVIIMV